MVVGKSEELAGCVGKTDSNTTVTGKSNGNAGKKRERMGEPHTDRADEIGVRLTKMEALLVALGADVREMAKECEK